MLELSCHNLALMLTWLSRDEIALVMGTRHNASWGSCPCHRWDQHVLTEQDTAEACLVESKDFVQQPHSQHLLLSALNPTQKSSNSCGE